MPNQAYADINTQCVECGRDFLLTAGEQAFYAGKGFELPKRCKECRAKRKQVREHELALIQEEKRKQENAQSEEELKQLLNNCLFKQVPFECLKNEKPSQSLFVVGNGFDIMHGAASSYWEFQKTLGKNSELRFHLETYLNVEPDILWYNFEDSLSHLNAGAMVDVMDMWLNDFDVYRNRADSMADLHCAIDAAMLPIQVITEQLPRRFRSWVETLTANGNKPCEHILSEKSLFLNFNYTDFIETLYGVPKSHICYIHGCRVKEKYHPKEQLVLGHVPNVDYLQDYEPSRTMVPHYKNPRKQEILDYAISVGINQWIEYYEDVFTKHTPDIIKEKVDFFEKAVDVEDIFVIGHSLSEVDYPYFMEMLRNNSYKARWHVGYHTVNDMKNIISFVQCMRIDYEAVEIFRT